ncbi:hypothetical protein IJ674_10540 [bacterium]|nr:hypothetical protein [bacterium]MBR1620313.1 hypothetical protein [bacterium]
MKNNNLKINNGCINIFRFLMLLYNDEADYNAVYNIFKTDIIEDGKVYDEKKLNNLIQVVINKYINALKVFGIKIRKEKHKYKLESSLYSVEYSTNDLKALSLIVGASKNLPDTNIAGNIEKLKANLFLRMCNSNKNTFNFLSTQKDFSFFYTDLKDQILQCKNYCNDNVILDITYLKRNKDIHTKCKPKEITYDVKTAYLNVYDIVKKENIEIALPNILSINVMPNRSTCYESPTTVVFKLKGRLAKIYKLKDGEKLQDKKDGEIIISNSGEPLDKLFSRLMRYADLCEIITPKFIRNDMINLINDTLRLYENK